MIGSVLVPPAPWDSPIYQLRIPKRRLTVKVTLSAPNFPGPLRALSDLSPAFREHGVKSILDFGAGKLRNTLSLLRQANGFKLTAVEYAECLNKSEWAKARLADAQSFGQSFHFQTPREFIDDSEVFDAVLLIDVLHIIPLKQVRKAIIDTCTNRLRSGGLLFLSAVHGEPNQQPGNQRRYSFGDGSCFSVQKNQRFQRFAHEYHFDEFKALVSLRQYKPGSTVHSEKHHALLFERR